MTDPRHRSLRYDVEIVGLGRDDIRIQSRLGEGEVTVSAVGLRSRPVTGEGQCEPPCGVAEHEGTSDAARSQAATVREAVLHRPHQRAKALAVYRRARARCRKTLCQPRSLPRHARMGAGSDHYSRSSVESPDI